MNCKNTCTVVPYDWPSSATEFQCQRQQMPGSDSWTQQTGNSQNAPTAHFPTPGTCRPWPVPGVNPRWGRKTAILQCRNITASSDIKMRFRLVRPQTSGCLFHPDCIDPSVTPRQKVEWPLLLNYSLNKRTKISKKHQNYQTSATREHL